FVSSDYAGGPSPRTESSMIMQTAATNTPRLVTFLRVGLVLRNRIIHLFGPRMNAPCHVLCVGKTIFTHPLRDAQAAHSVMTVYHDPLVREIVELGCRLGPIAHRQQYCTSYSGGFPFTCFTTIDQNHFFASQ